MKHRSAISGKAVSDEYAKANKSTTVKESKSKDTKRLDWLTRNRAGVSPRETDWWITWWNKGPVDVVGNSLRKAIDAAMKTKSR